MKCPKCSYLSFEPEARCRNCGYDFALADNDLVIKAVSEDDGPMQDFDLHVPSPVMPPAPAPVTLGLIHPAAPIDLPKPDVPLRLMTSVGPASLPEIRPALSSAPPPLVRPVRPPSTTTELPLFMQGLPADHGIDAPLVQVPASPRPPLSVRRRSDLSPDVVRPDRASHVEMAAHVDSVWAPLPVEHDDIGRPPEEPILAKTAAPIDATGAGGGVDASARATAAGVDLLVLGGIDAVVLWMTARICGIGLDSIFSLPFAPLLAFFALLDVGYLFLFTAASGQTIGKMTAGIRVVPEDSASEQESLSMRQAIVRAIATVPSVFALGAGFLPALAGRGLAVHDRLAHTRVVRV